MGGAVFTIDSHWINPSGKLHASWFFSKECLIGLISRLWMWVTMFSSKQGRKGHGAGHYGAPCQPVLLQASLPINLAMSAPNKQVTNDKWTAKCSFSISVSLFPHTITCFYAPELAIQTQEVKGRGGTDTKKSAPSPFLFQKISLGNICLNSPGVGVYKEGEKHRSYPKAAATGLWPVGHTEFMLKEMCVCNKTSATSLWRTL